jgi:hypothetical protein
MKKAPVRIILCLAWLVGVGTGVVALLNYENAPGRSGQTPLQWPADALITPDPSRPTLLMFAHPQCPCTRASIGELNRLLARCEGKLAVHVFFLQPAALPDEWTQSGTWSEAAALRDVAVHGDRDGAQARRFGAETSGFVALFSPEGKLLFQGGITGSRAHAGDNAGANVIASLVAGRDADLTQTPVYGCSLGETCASTELGGDAWTR